MKVLAGVETGGITTVASIADPRAPKEIINKKIFPTETPDETVSKVCSWLKQFDIAALGIASFGPIDIDRKSKTYGYVTSTPKKKWKNFNLIKAIRTNLGNEDLPVGFQTDVNTAALAENMTDRHSALDSCVYITIGGGIGVGLSYKKSPFVGLSHTEGGHFKPRRYVNRVGETDDFEGTCDYHSDCVEGLSNAPSLAKRLGIEVDDLATVEDDHEIWVARFLTQGSLRALHRGAVRNSRVHDLSRGDCARRRRDEAQKPLPADQGESSGVAFWIYPIAQNNRRYRRLHCASGL